MRMTLALISKTMTPDHEEDGSPWAELKRERRALVVVDVVESVRLMQSHEDDVIRRWRRFVNEVRAVLLPAHGGRMVKSLGDGMLLDFPALPQAVAASFDIERLSAQQASGVPPDRQIRLRQGVHLADVLVGEEDVYGAGVNLAARLAGLAQPGQLVGSSEARDQLVDAVHARLVDLGECYLKHIAEPVRAYRLEPPDDDARPWLGACDDSLLPRVVFVLATQAPAAAAADSDAVLLAQTVCAELAAGAARMGHWRVISGLSAARSPALATAAPPSSAEPWLADHVVTVAPATGHGPAALTLRCLEARTLSCLWERVVPGPAQAWLSAEVSRVGEVLVELSAALSLRASGLSHQAAVHNLPAYALLLSAIGLLHRTSRADASRSATVLDHLVERHPRSAEARFWLAKWHFMSLVQHWSEDLSRTGRQVMESLDRALELDPAHGASRALRAHLTTLLGHNAEQAQADLAATTRSHPNEPLGWLFLAGSRAFLGEGSLAAKDAGSAWALSPLDPLDYFYLNFAAKANLAAGEHEQAWQQAQRSVRINALHLPGLSTLMIAQVLSGREAEAQATARHYLSLRPNASVSNFLRHHPTPDGEMARRDAQALRVAGIPLH